MWYSLDIHLNLEMLKIKQLTCGCVDKQQDKEK